MATSTVSYSALVRSGASQITYPALMLDELSPVVVDPEEPELFGEPNYHLAALWAPILTTADICDLRLARLCSPGIDNGYQPVRLVAFHGHDSVTTAELVDPSGKLVEWFRAIAQPMPARPIELRYSPAQQGSGVMSGFDDMHNAAWIIAAAPSEWLAKSQSDDKALLLDQAKADGPTAAVSSTSPAEIASLWTQLCAARAISIQPGAQTADAARFVKATGFAVPTELWALLEQSNGAAAAFDYGDLMSLNAIIDAWSGWKAIFDEFTLDDLQQSYTSDAGRTVALYTTPYWVPFVDQGTGNQLAIDLLPGPAGVHGQVIEFGADIDLIGQVAPSLGDFLRSEVARSQPAAAPAKRPRRRLFGGR